MSENFENDERGSSWQSASSRRGGGQDRRKFTDKDRSSASRRWSDDRGDRRGGRGFDRDDRRGGRGFDRDRRDGGFDRRDDRRGGGSFDREDRGARRWSDDRRGSRDDRGGRSFDRDDRRGGRGFDRDDRRGGRGFDRDRREDFGGNREDRRGGFRGGRPEGGRDGRPQRLSDRDRGFERRDNRRDDRRDEREFDDPIVPVEITPEDLNRDARRHLLSLNKDNADRVSRFLVMAGSLMDSNPELAYEHAKAAYRRASRIDIVREALGLTAYATEKYGEALRELRTYRRMSGDPSHLYLEADCERGMGRPERAIKYLEEANLSELTPQTQIELALVVSGAYADLDESEKGLALIESLRVEEFSDDLRAPIELVRAERLRELGREDEAAAIDEAWAPIWESEEIEVFDEADDDSDFDDDEAEIEDDSFEDEIDVDDSDDVYGDDDVDDELDDEDEAYLDEDVDDDEPSEQLTETYLDESGEDVEGDDRFSDIRADDARRD